MNYPFAAIVGQEKLKQALMLCAINPAIGGVLIRGEKGTAKSTAARGIADITPFIPDENATSEINKNEEICGECPVENQEMAVPFVNLPLGATEDRVLGSLDVEGILNDRKRRLQPGLLAAAHCGILYIDEVNLLSDHLVDVLLDVAAMGVNTIQRDGLSESHPAKFTLIGTMNPEEGSLRPQFLDRFGLMVDVEAPRNVEERTEVVRRRIAFENDKEIFIGQWTQAQNLLRKKIKSAQRLLPMVTMPDGLLTLISQLCTQLNVTSLRADIVMYKTSVTLAALEGRKIVSAEDIKKAAELVLPHRRQKKNAENNRPKENENLDDAIEQASSSQAGPGKEPEQTPQQPANENAQSQEQDQSGENKEQFFGAAATAPLPDFQLKNPRAEKQKDDGKRNNAAVAPKGRAVSAKKNSAASDISILSTIRHSAVRDPENFQISREDLHQKVYSGKTGNLILFIVDASGSMSAGKRMEAVKGSVLTLLTDAYEKRDMVGVISFRGIHAELILEPTRSIEHAEQAMQNLPTGGRTPLPHALFLAKELVSNTDKNRDRDPLLIILSDGKANVPLPGGGDAWQQTLQLCGDLQEMGVQSIVLDTEREYLRFGKAKTLSAALGAKYFSLENLSSETIIETIPERQIW